MSIYTHSLNLNSKNSSNFIRVLFFFFFLFFFKMAGKDLEADPILQQESNNNGINEKFEEESATIANHQDIHKKNRMKFLAYFLVFFLCQTGIILLFALTLMKVRTPKFRVHNATFETFDVNVGTGNPSFNSFNLRMNVELELKNNNFGDYKYLNGTVYFFYDGDPIGEAVFPKSKAGIRSTKKFYVVVNISSLTSKGPRQRVNAPGSAAGGVLTLKSRSKLRGKVELIKVLKKKISTNMDCDLTFGVSDRAIRQISCK